MSGDQGALREALARGESLIGTFCIVPSTDVVEMIALAGFDFVVIDMEHGPFSMDTARACLLAAAARDLPAVVRVASADVAGIGLVLDMGCAGVLVPQVSTAAQARTVVEASRFTPAGKRGANPWVRAAAYSGEVGWFERANRDVVVMVMIEGTEGLDALEDIIEVPGLDAVFLGPVDLSHSLGVPGQTDHQRVVEAIEAVVRRAARHGLAAAVFAPDAHRARAWVSLGLPMVACGIDSDLILRAFCGTTAVARGSSS